MMTGRRLVILVGAMLAVEAGAPASRGVAQSEEYFAKRFRVPRGAAPTRIIGMDEEGWSRDGFVTLYPTISGLGKDVFVDYPGLPPGAIAPMFGRLYRYGRDGFTWVKDKDMPPGLEWETGSFGIPLQREFRGKKYGRAKIHDQYVYVDRIGEDEQGPYAIMHVHYRLGGVRGTSKKLRAGDVLDINGHRNKILRVVPRSFRFEDDLPFDETYVVIGWVEIDPKPLKE